MKVDQTFIDFALDTLYARPARGSDDFGQGPETRWEACFLPFTGDDGRVSHLPAGLAYA